VKILPTLEGGLRIDAEDRADWHLLAAIADDAVDRKTRLADQLGGLITAEEIAEDWREYIIPDLDAAFQSDIARVAAAIQIAHDASNGEAGPLWIERDDGPAWYSVLNQARLALEDHHHFGPSEHIEMDSLPPQKRVSFLRSQFYCAFQSLLLDHVM
jgi:hypothetical protein